MNNELKFSCQEMEWLFREFNYDLVLFRFNKYFDNFAFDNDVFLLGELISNVIKYDADLAIEMFNKTIDTYREKFKVKKHCLSFWGGLFFANNFETMIDFIKNNLNSFIKLFSVSYSIVANVIKDCFANIDNQNGFDIFNLVFNYNQKEYSNDLMIFEILNNLRDPVIYKEDNCYIFIDRNTIDNLENWINCIVNPQYKARAIVFFIQIEDRYNTASKNGYTLKRIYNVNSKIQYIDKTKIINDLTTCYEMIINENNPIDIYLKNQKASKYLGLIISYMFKYNLNNCIKMWENVFRVHETELLKLTDSTNLTRGVREKIEDDFKMDNFVDVFKNNQAIALYYFGKSCEIDTKMIAICLSKGLYAEAMEFFELCSANTNKRFDNNDVYLKLIVEELHYGEMPCDKMGKKVLKVWLDRVKDKKLKDEINELIKNIGKQQ